MATRGRDDEEPSAYRGIVSEESASVGAHYSASANRNTGPILEVLAGLLPNSGFAVEIASGTGQHAIAMATRFPAIHWTPSDREPEARDSIAAWAADAGLANLAPPLDIDLNRPDWHLSLPAPPGAAPIDAIVAFNVIHITPWATTEALLDGAAAALGPGGAGGPGGLLYVYSCFSRDGVQLSPSNIAFDARLRGRNPDWGVRDTADLTAAAQARGLALENIFEMPANNLSLAFRKVGQFVRL